MFLGQPDGTFTAYDAKTLKELWSFNVGTGINAPPITYSVNGKQYIAVLVGSRQPPNIIPLSPELKNTSTASMLFVFALYPAKTRFPPARWPPAATSKTDCRLRR